MFKRIDGGNINELTRGSHKIVLFNCDTCQKEVKQSYRTYLAQNDGHYCRSCRNSHTANRPDVKEKVSSSVKKMWAKPEYRERMSKILSDACKVGWQNESRKKWLSENNPMKREDIKIKHSERFNTNERYKKAVEDVGYTYLGKTMGHMKKIHYICDKGHERWQRWTHFKYGSRCGLCAEQFSQMEKDMLKYVRTIYNGLILENDRTQIVNPDTGKNLELDIFLPDLNKAIEFNGVFWHNKETEKRDKFKKEQCQERGISLLVINESDWTDNKSNCLETIKAHLTT